MTEMKSTAESVLAIDSNLLVYFADNAEPHKHAQAKRFFHGLLQSKIPLAVCIQNLREFAFVMLEKKKMEPTKINEFVEQFSSFEKILFESPSDVSNAVRWNQQHKTPFWDALLASTLLRSGITTIYTENTKDFEKQGIKVVNPLK